MYKMRGAADWEESRLFMAIPTDIQRFVKHVENANDPAVMLFRLKKVRDHTAVSQLRAAALRRGENHVMAITTSVAMRALNGPHPLHSILLCTDSVVEKSVTERDKFFGALRAKLTAMTLDHPVLIAPKTVFDEILGLTLTLKQSMAAIFDVKPVELIPAVEKAFAARKNAHRYEKVQRQMERCQQVVDRAVAEDKTDHPVPVLREDAVFPLLILDDVRSPDNVGAILRTAFSLGLTSVLCSPTSFAAINARSGRVSMGALFHFAVYRTDDLAGTILSLRENFCVHVIGTSPQGETVLGPCGTRKWALLLGNEASGADEKSLLACSVRCRIPQVRGDSFSVTAAAAICLYELQRRLHSDNGQG